MPDISIRKEMQRIRAEHPAVFAFSPSQIVGSAKDGCDFVDFSANFPNHRIELNLESKPSVDSFPMQRHGRPKPSPRSSATKSSVKKSLTNEKNIETLLRAEHEYSPNKLQLFQVNYDKANLIKIPVLAAELKEADYGSVSHIEDDLGVSVSIKRLKLSEKSFVSQYEDNQQLDIAKDNNNLDDKDSIINSIETVCRE
jgi:hypothetical protein